MIPKEEVHAMEPHPQIQFKISSAPPPPTYVAKKMESSGLIFTGPKISPGLGVVTPESRKRKPSCFLPNSQQDVMGLQRSSPSSSYRARCAPTIEAIRAKYGPIDKDCVLKSGLMKERSLDVIGYMLQTLNGKKIDELEVGFLDEFYKIVIDAENVLKIDVKWLRKHLDEISEAITRNKEAKLIILRRNECMKKVEYNKEKVKKLKAQIEMSEKQMEEDLVRSKILDNDIKALTAKFQHFQQTSPTEGLL